MLEDAGFSVTHTAMVPDEQAHISAVLRDCADQRHIDLIITTGGTGLSPRDVTPEATLAVLDREIRAIPVAMWMEGLNPPCHVVPRGGRDAGPQPDHQPARLGKSRAGEPVRHHRCSGARHAHDRRRGPRITHPVRPQQVRTFPSFSPILWKIPLRFPSEGYFYCFCGSPYFLMTATAQGILPRHRV